MDIVDELIPSSILSETNNSAIGIAIVSKPESIITVADINENVEIKNTDANVTSVDIDSPENGNKENYGGNIENDGDIIDDDFEVSVGVNSDISVHLDKEMSDVMLKTISNIIFEQNMDDVQDEISTCDDSDKRKTEQENNKLQDGFFHCDKCDRKIRRKDNFKRHMFQVHNIKFQERSVTNNYKNICIFPGCEEVFYHKSRMVKHLEEFHRLEVDMEYQSFCNFMEFTDWKEAEESSNFVCFTKRDERKISKNISYSSYVCQCDGGQSNKDLKKYMIRRKGVKRDIICPARMLVRRNVVTDHVAVKYIKSHSHPISYEDLNNHPIPKSVKEQITKKLMGNKSVDDVFSELHQEAIEENISNSNNMALKKIHIHKAKIRYIQQRLNIPKNINKNTMLIEDRLKSLTTGDFNPILLYKPDGLIIDQGNGDNIPNGFIFAMQTKEQCEMFQKYADQIVFIELTHPIPSIPYHIFTLKVLDDYLQCYNVAHLISSFQDDRIVEIFLNEIKSRCSCKIPQINIVMVTMDYYGLKAFQSVFNQNIQFIYSKWHFHKVMFSKLLSDYPIEQELRQQVYFTLVALIEETDMEQFQSIATEFINSYKDLCPLFVKFIFENYLSKPERWALCHRDPLLHKCDHVMHLNTTFQQLKTLMKVVKDVCTVDDLLHNLLNIDQETYLKQQRLEHLKTPTLSPHEIGLGIPDEDVSKIAESQWLIVSENLTFEVNLISEVCMEEFCQIRCLELTCFGLCHHMYNCTCRGITFSICSHIHKIHSMETGVPSFQSIFEDTNSQPRNTKFKLYEQMSSRISQHEKKDLLSFVRSYLDSLNEYIDKPDINLSSLKDISVTLEGLVERCKNYTEGAPSKCSESINDGK